MSGNVISTTAACVFLHNFCETHNDEFIQEWTATSEDITSASGAATMSLNVPPSSTAHNIRDTIATYIHAQQ